MLSDMVICAEFPFAIREASSCHMTHLHISAVHFHFRFNSYPDVQDGDEQIDHIVTECRLRSISWQSSHGLVIHVEVLRWLMSSRVSRERVTSTGASYS